MDFTSDDHIENGLFEKKNSIKKLLSFACLNVFKLFILADTNKSLINKKQVPEKGPVMLLYELFTDVQIDCISSSGVQHSRFKMVATVDNRKFEGTGESNFKAIKQLNLTNF